MSAPRLHVVRPTYADEIIFGIKECCHCRRWLPANGEQFSLDRRAVDGHKDRCKKCDRDMARSEYRVRRCGGAA